MAYEISTLTLLSNKSRMDRITSTVFYVASTEGPDVKYGVLSLSKAQMINNSSFPSAK